MGFGELHKVEGQWWRLGFARVAELERVVHFDINVAASWNVACRNVATYEEELGFMWI